MIGNAVVPKARPTGGAESRAHQHPGRAVADSVGAVASNAVWVVSTRHADSASRDAGRGGHEHDRASGNILLDASRRQWRHERSTLRGKAVGDGNSFA